MTAVVTKAVGDSDQLALCEVPKPTAGPGEILVQVSAAGVNNTDINPRLGWYSTTVSTATSDSSEDLNDLGPGRITGGWNGATPFPLIQGADCCGRAIAVGDGVDQGILGSRVLIYSCILLDGADSVETQWLGSDRYGAFAQFTVVRAHDVFPVESPWSDAELTTISCAYGTAENMVSRAGVATGTRVLVPGASGGAGSSVVELAKRRGAYVIGIASGAKRERVLELGADEVVKPRVWWRVN